MENNIILIMDELFNKFGIVVDWTSENVLPYLMELMGRLRVYEIVQNSFVIFISLLLLIPIVVTLKSYTKCRKIKKDTIIFVWCKDAEFVEFKDTSASVAMFSAVSTIISILIFFNSIKNLLEWIFIPEFAMIEYMTNMVN